MMGWNGIARDGMRWDGTGWDGMEWNAGARYVLYVSLVSTCKRMRKVGKHFHAPNQTKLSIAVYIQATALL